MKSCTAVLTDPHLSSVPIHTVLCRQLRKPDFLFLWIYTVLSYLPPWMEIPALFTAPVLGIGLLIGLPFAAGVGEKGWWRRPTNH